MELEQPRQIIGGWFDLPVFDQMFLGAPLSTWAVAGVLWLALALAMMVAKWILTGRLNALARSHPTLVSEVLQALAKRMRSWVLIAIAAYLALLLAAAPPRFVAFAEKVAILILLVQAVRWGGVLITHSLQHYQQKRLENDPAAVTSLQALAFLARVLLWSVVLLLALENLGVDVTALIAGVGVAGIAVGLALQSVLGDLFASLSIVIDKPFVVGDFLIVDDFLGTVEHIGLKTTRLRSLSGEQLVFGNSDLLGSRIRNYKRMQERRVVSLLQIAYQTPYEQLQQIPGLLRRACEDVSEVRFDRAHFKNFGEYALTFELVYWVLSSDYAVFMERQQDINLAIHRLMQEVGAAFAYPTQSLYLLRAPDGVPARPQALDEALAGTEDSAV